MDMIVTTKKDGVLTLNFYYHENILNNTANFAMGGFLDQVLLFDYNGDMETDILGTTVDGTVCLVRDGNNYTEVTDHGFPNFTIPNSNAFLDFDGDCHADLFFTEKAEDETTKFSIWVWNSTNQKYERSKVYNAPKGAGQVSFSDFSK